MKKRKYLRRLIAVMVLGLTLPAILAFHIFWQYSINGWMRSNEDLYSSALKTYVTQMDKKLQELGNFASRISAESREPDSRLQNGGIPFLDDTYQTYMVIRELGEKYSRGDVSEWGIYFYDINKIITPKYAYTPENFIYKYTGQTMEEASCADFFSQEKYSLWEPLFDSAMAGVDRSSQYLFAGRCTKIGLNNDRALVFFVISPKDISDSLAIVGGEGISYYLRQQETGEILLEWGECPGEAAEDILAQEEWERHSGVRRRVRYDIPSSYPQLTVTAHVSGNSFQNSFLELISTTRTILILIAGALIVICLAAVYISYKPMYELTSEFDYDGGSEFDTIRHKLGDQVIRIKEQHMLILDLLVAHLLYGVPIAVEQFTRLGIDKDMQYYCTFLLEGCPFVNSAMEKLTEIIEKEYRVRVFATDLREEKCSVLIVFLQDEDISGVQDRLEQWLKEQCPAEGVLYTGKVYDKLENIQLSFHYCLEQMKRKNGRKSKEKAEGTGLTPKKEQQKKLLDDILVYLENNYRDSNLSQMQVADLFQISNYTLSRLFKNSVGVGFSEYLAAKRLEYAKELLLTTSHTVKEISVMSGFTSENYFSRTFKLYEGVSPSNFRSQ